MTPIDPAELSAFLDGEVSAERAREIESMLAADAALSDEFEVLAKTDALWRGAGREAAFMPAVMAPAAEQLLGWPQAVALIGLLGAFKILTKLGEGIAFGLLTHGFVFAAFLIGFAWFAARQTETTT